MTNHVTGHVGVPLPCNIVKLVDVEEMNYFASNGEGEVRSHLVFFVLCLHGVLFHLSGSDYSHFISA